MLSNLSLANILIWSPRFAMASSAILYIHESG